MSGWREIVVSDLVEKICVGFVGVCQKYYCNREDGVPMIRTTNLTEKGMSLDDVKYVSYDFHSKNKKSQLKKGDILVARHGDNGKACMYNLDIEANCLNAVIIRPDSMKVNPKFFLYQFNSPQVRSLIESMSSGSVQDVINTKQISKIKLSIPPLPKQKAIAAVLSSLDDKIDLLHRQNATLEAMAETLFRQWFVVEAGEDWEDGEVGKLGDEFDFTMGQSPLGSSFNEDGIGVPMFQGNADFEFRFPKERVYTTEPTRFAQKYDTLISVRAPVGAQNMALKKCCIGREVAAFRYKADNDCYTYTYFKLRSLMDDIKKFNDEGTVFGSIGKSEFDALKTFIPPLELVTGFEKKSKPINDKVIKNCAQIRTLEKLRDTLLPKLMSGEVRVKV